MLTALLRDKVPDSDGKVETQLLIDEMVELKTLCIHFFDNPAKIRPALKLISQTYDLSSLGVVKKPVDESEFFNLTKVRAELTHPVPLGHAHPFGAQPQRHPPTPQNKFNPAKY